MTTILVVLLVALSICLVRIWDSLGKQIRRVDVRLDELEKSLYTFRLQIEKRVQELGIEQVVNSEIISNFNKKVDVLGNVRRQDLQDHLDINKYINSRIHELRKEVEAIKKTRAIAKAPKRGSNNSVNKPVKSVTNPVESVTPAKSVVESVKKKR